MSVSISNPATAEGICAINVSNSAGVKMRYSGTGTVGVFTPLQGCSTVTKSLSAVVNTADRMILRWRICAGLTPSSTRSVTHSRTSVGMMSRIFIGPNHGMMRASRL